MEFQSEVPIRVIRRLNEREGVKSGEWLDSNWFVDGGGGVQVGDTHWGEFLERIAQVQDPQETDEDVVGWRGKTISNHFVGVWHEMMDQGLLVWSGKCALDCNTWIITTTT